MVHNLLWYYFLYGLIMVYLFLSPLCSAYLFNGKFIYSAAHGLPEFIYIYLLSSTYIYINLHQFILLYIFYIDLLSSTHITPINSTLFASIGAKCVNTFVRMFASIGAKCVKTKQRRCLLAQTGQVCMDSISMTHDSAPAKWVLRSTGI